MSSNLSRNPVSAVTRFVPTLDVPPPPVGQTEETVESPPLPIASTASEDASINSYMFRVTDQLATRHGVSPLIALSVDDGAVALCIIRDKGRMDFIHSEDATLLSEAGTQPGRVVMRILGELKEGAE